MVARKVAPEKVQELVIDESEIVYVPPLDLDKGLSDNITLDPSDPVDAVLIEIATLNRAKRADYAGSNTDDNPFQNFYDSALQVSITPGQSAEVLIATKQSRLKVLQRPSGLPPKNESIRDTQLDRAVYSVIAVALQDEGSYGSDWLEA